MTEKTPGMGRREFFRRTGGALAGGLTGGLAMKAHANVEDVTSQAEEVGEKKSEMSYEDQIAEVLEQLKEHQESVDEDKGDWSAAAEAILNYPTLEGAWNDEEREMIMEIAETLRDAYKRLEGNFYQIGLAIQGEEPMDDILDLVAEYEHTKGRITFHQKRAKRMPHFDEYKIRAEENDSEVHHIKHTEDA